MSYPIHIFATRYRLAIGYTHQSDTARVVFAEDEDELAGCKAVALKLMSDPEAVEREIAQLHRAQLLDTKHVVLALRFHLARPLNFKQQQAVIQLTH